MPALEQQRPGDAVAPDLLAALRQRLEVGRHLARREVDVEVVAEPGGDAEGDAPAVAADQERDVVAAAVGRRVDAVLDPGVAAPERDALAAAARHAG